LESRERNKKLGRHIWRPFVGSLLVLVSILFFPRGGESIDAPVERQRVDFQDISFELPGSGWERIEEKNPGRIQFLRKEGQGPPYPRAQSISVWPMGVPPMLRGLSRKEHASKYFDSERRLPRYGRRWEGFIEGEREIGGQKYPIMSFRIIPPPAETSGLFLLYFSQGFEERQRFYVFMWNDFSANEQSSGLNDFDSVVSSFRVRPLR